MADIGGALGGFGGAVSDLFGGLGQLSARTGYKRAARISYANANIAEASAKIEETQQQRQLYKVLGGQQSDVASAGFANSGTAQDLFRESQQQGSLAKALISDQGQINKNSYLSQAYSYDAQAAAAKKSGIGSIISGVFQAGASIAALFSDVRLKHNIHLHGWREDGFGIYSFCYNGSTQRYLGLMAQEVQQLYPEVVEEDISGFLKVRYDMLGVSIMPLGNA